MIDWKTYWYTPLPPKKKEGGGEKKKKKKKDCNGRLGTICWSTNLSINARLTVRVWWTKTNTQTRMATIKNL